MPVPFLLLDHPTWSSSSPPPTLIVMASAQHPTLHHNFSNMAATIFLKKDFRLEELKVFEAATSFGGILPGLGFSAIKARFLLITLLSAEQRKLTSLLSTKINFYLHSAIFRCTQCGENIANIYKRGQILDRLCSRTWSRILEGICVIAYSQENYESACWVYNIDSAIDTML